MSLEVRLGSDVRFKVRLAAGVVEALQKRPLEDRQAFIKELEPLVQEGAEGKKQDVIDTWQSVRDIVSFGENNYVSGIRVSGISAAFFQESPVFSLLPPEQRQALTEKIAKLQWTAVQTVANLPEKNILEKAEKAKQLVLAEWNEVKDQILGKKPVQN